MTRMTVSRCCCRCRFGRAVGSSHGIDTFDSLDGGWVNARPAYDSWSATGMAHGATHTEPPSFTPQFPFLYRAVDRPAVGGRILQECRVFNTFGSTSCGLMIQHEAIFGALFSFWSLHAHWGAGVYVISRGGSENIIIPIVPAEGDLITMAVERQASYRMCMWVKGQLVHSESIGVDVPAIIQCGLTFFQTGVLDDYGLDA